MRAACWAYGGMADWSPIVCVGDVGDWCNAGRAAGSRTHTQSRVCAHTTTGPHKLAVPLQHWGSFVPTRYPLKSHSFLLPLIRLSLHTCLLKHWESCLLESDWPRNWRKKKLWSIVTAVMSHTSVCVCKGQCTGYEHYPTQLGLPKLVPVYSWGGMCWLDDDRGQLANRKAMVAKWDS